MQYFGFAKCPYCGKRVNAVRSWSLKKEGEYRCPRCGGISNVFLSPLVYVLAVIAFFASAAIYFFHKFVFDDIDILTFIPVLVPFILFFILGTFTVYLKKPVIKKISREELERKKRFEENKDYARTDSVNRSVTGGRRKATGFEGRRVRQEKRPESRDFENEDSIPVSLNIPTGDGLRMKRNFSEDMSGPNYAEATLRGKKIDLRKNVEVKSLDSEILGDDAAGENNQRNFFDDSDEEA